MHRHDNIPSVQKLQRVSGPGLTACVQLLLEYYYKFNDWERDFLDSIADQPEHVGVTEKQLRVIVRLLAKAAR